MKNVYLSGKVHTSASFRPQPCVGFIPRSNEPLAFVGDNGKPIKGLLGFVPAFDSYNAAQAFDPFAHVITLTVLEDGDL